MQLQLSCCSAAVKMNRNTITGMRKKKALREQEKARKNKLPHTSFHFRGNIMERKQVLTDCVDRLYNSIAIHVALDE